MKLDSKRIIASAALAAIAGAYLYLRHLTEPSISVVAVIGCSVGVFCFFSIMGILFGGEEKPWNPKAGFDWSMHYFRAFAIVCIVLTHFTGFFGYGHVKSILFRSSTVYFLLISGYLCQFLALKRGLVASEYYRSKLNNVISPYAVWTLVFFALAHLDTTVHSGMNSAATTGGIAVFVKGFVSGDTSTHLWYIPFVSILFLLSPLFVRMSNNTLVLTTAVAGFFYLLFPCRLGLSLNPVVSFSLYCHFTVFYLLGFLYARYKVRCDEKLARYWPIFAGMALLCTWRLIFPEYRLLGKELMPLDLAITLQKLFFATLIILVLWRIKDKRIKLLDLIARYSFGIYFIHYYFISDVRLVRDGLLAGTSLSMPLICICDALIGGGYVLMLLGICVLMKNALGAKSRFFTGA